MFKRALLIGFILCMASGALTAQEGGFIKAGYNAIMSGNYDAAVENYTRAIEKHSGYAPSYYGRGLALSHKENYNAAIEDFNRAVELNPSFHEAYYALGLCYVYTGDYTKALENLDKAVSINNRNSNYFYARANTYSLMQDGREKALADYARAMDTDPSNGLPFYGRAVLYMKMERESDAMKDFEKYIELNGNKDGLAAEAQRLITEIQTSNE
ncbi:MAG TPA: tetratricopeptide repeat protein [Ignavibacteriales bacterium]|nr:tetratricopeptide repeat protein [Ignavibacteriales bacterium]